MELADLTQGLERWGLLALFVLTALENLNLPLPSEPALLYAGFLAFEGTLNLPLVIVVALAGTLVGAAGSYLIGHRGRWILDRHGRWVGATPARVEASDRWMTRHGDKAVLYGRVIPLVRTFVSVAGGAARMPFLRFLTLTAIGAGAWITLLVGLGYTLEDAWQKAEGWLEPLKFGLLGALAVGAFVVAVRWWRRRPGPQAPTAS